MSTSASRYGPHRQADAPTHLVEVSAGKRVLLRPGRVEPAHVGSTPCLPIATAMVRQRAHLNAIAHHGRVSRGPCRTCGRDEWDCPVRPATVTPDPHEYEPARG